MTPPINQTWSAFTLTSDSRLRLPLNTSVINDNEVSILESDEEEASTSSSKDEEQSAMKH